jgi:hypothetical protein
MQETMIIQAARPEDLKAAIDALIADSKTIEIVEALANKSYYLIVFK